MLYHSDIVFNSLDKVETAPCWCHGELSSVIEKCILFAGDIKQILETELQVPVSKMQLKGWKSGDVSDSVSISLI